MDRRYASLRPCALGFHYGTRYARLGRAVDRLSEMSGRGDLAMGAVLVIVSVLYFLLFL